LLYLNSKNGTCIISKQKKADSSYFKYLVHILYFIWQRRNHKIIIIILLNVTSVVTLFKEHVSTLEL